MYIKSYSNITIIRILNNPSFDLSIIIPNSNLIAKRQKEKQIETEIQINYPSILLQNKITGKKIYLKLSNLLIKNLNSKILTVSYENPILKLDLIIPDSTIFSNLINLFKKIFNLLEQFNIFEDFIKNNQIENNTFNISAEFIVNEEFEITEFSLSFSISSIIDKNLFLEKLSQLKFDNFKFNLIRIKTEKSLEYHSAIEKVKIVIGNGNLFDFNYINYSDILKLVDEIELCSVLLTFRIKNKEQLCYKEFEIPIEVVNKHKDKIINIVKFLTSDFYELLAPFFHNNVNQIRKNGDLFLTILNKFENNFNEINDFIKLLKL